jgi:hypothetical protein
MRLRILLTRLRRDDRGEAILAAVIAWTIIIPLLAAVFQAALWFAARNTALTAAQQGVSVARDRGSSLGAGEAAACSFASMTGHGFLLGPSCAGSGGNTVSITVSGRAPSFIPFFNASVTETVTGPAERWTTAQIGGAP